MSETNSLPDQELVDLAALLAIPTDDKPAVAAPAPEPIAAPASNGTSPAPVAGAASPDVKLSDVIKPEESAENMLNMIDGIQSLLFSAVYTAKAFYALNKEDRAKYKAAKKKSIAERTADEIQLIEAHKAIFEHYQKKSDKTDFTEKEMTRLRKPAIALVVQKNIKVSPGLAFGFILTDIISDRLIDVILDE